MPLNPPIPRIKPPALQAGDTVGIIAPASNIKREHLEAGCDALRKLGYKPFYLESIFDKRSVLSLVQPNVGLANWRKCSSRDDVRAIVCARGGYGSNYLLEALDLDKSKRTQKFSSATAISRHC